MKLSLAQLQQCLTLKDTCVASDFSIRHPSSVICHLIATDSRKVTPGCLFVALIGERFDAHDFLDDVVKQGAAAVVVQRLPHPLSIPALIVPDTKKALGEIAHAWRKQFNLPVIGVTGSNGKTTVKEMIASILKAEFGAAHFLATQGNLNNDIGVPQTLYRLTEQHRAAVIEMGANHPGEIGPLAALAAPTVGLVNNAQREHQEFLQSVEAVAKENGSVITGLPGDGIAVFPAEDTYRNLWRSYAGNRTVITFGFTNVADIWGTYQVTELGCQLTVMLNSPIPVIPKEMSRPLHFQRPIQLAAAGKHNVLNALAAIAACHAIGCSHEAIVTGLESFQPVAGRLQKKQAKQAVILDDTYNANPDSVRAAIDVLAHTSGINIVVLGDMGEVGAQGQAYHTEIGAYAKQRGMTTLLTLGELTQHSCAAFGQGALHFDRIEFLLEKLDEVIRNQKTPVTVLIKGSRFMKMERVVAHLMNQEK
jgi:UDP-N-acetylmuramoyl-tripeptide--D-alanyl-D-alanine ligase